MQHLQKTEGRGPASLRGMLPIPLLELTSPLRIHLYFQPLPRCPFCNSFLFTFMHGMGGMGGALPTFQHSNVPTFQRPSIYPLSFQFVTHASPPRPHLNSFAINSLRTLFVSTEGVPPFSLAPYFLTSFSLPPGTGNHLPVSWTSYQFPPPESGCTLKPSQSKVRP
jgi:hypothetical protein